MTYVVLARRWRPQRFLDLVGQEHVARTLANAIACDRVAHAFLFTGVRGVGKTTSARILAKALNCLGDPDDPEDHVSGPRAEPCLKCAACLEIALGTDVDVREIDGASYNGVDEVRKLQDSLPYRPQRDRFKIVIVDEVHMLSQNAWNAFLKTLEEPPPHVKFIFATTEAHKIPITILSRVQRFDFKLIPSQLIAARLRHVLDVEKIRCDDDAISVLAREAAGSMRDAMSLLDQVIAWNDQHLTGENVARVLGVATRSALHAIMRSLVAGDAQKSLEVVAELSDQGYDTTHVARYLLALLRDLVVVKVCEDSKSLLDVSDIERKEITELAQATDADDLIRLHQGFSAGFDSIARSGQPRAALEMLLVRLARRPPLIPIDDLVQRLAQLERRLGASGEASGKTGPAGPSRPSAPRGVGSPTAKATPQATAASTPRPRERDSSTPARTPSAIRTELPPERRALTPAEATPQAPSASHPRVEVAFPDDADIAEEIRNDTTLLTWHRMLGKLHLERPELAAFLAHAVPVELNRDSIRIGWPPESLFAQETGDASAIESLGRAAESEWGTKPTVRFELGSPEASGVRTLAAIYSAERERKTGLALESARNHPAVRETMNLLGARIKDVRLGAE